MCLSVFRNSNYNSNAKALALALVFSLVFVSFVVSETEAQLRVGFYAKTCPKVESIVAKVVEEAASVNPRIPAILLRLHFHDCFVEGCDGSILIENGDNAENNAFGHQGLGGFEEVRKAKTQIEALCPGVVSCADIVALAARDAVVLAELEHLRSYGSDSANKECQPLPLQKERDRDVRLLILQSKGPLYEVETGRRDGRVSRKSLADGMPDVDDSIQVLKSKFINKGLSEKDLVVLSAAHTIGTTACFFLGNRLYNFNGKSQQSDPSININFVQNLKQKCPKGGDVNARLPMDEKSELVFDDNILRNIKNGFAVIASDARLNDDMATKQVIDAYVAPSNSSFFQDFALAMVKLGRLGVKTGTKGEIRKKCSAFN